VTCHLHRAVNCRNDDDDDNDELCAVPLLYPKQSVAVDEHDTTCSSVTCDNCAKCRHKILRETDDELHTQQTDSNAA
jgi:hypothetical protein